jgi:hypothetical protein
MYVRFREQARSHIDFRLLPDMDWPAGLFCVFKQHRIRVYHVWEIYFQQQRQIIA